MGAMGGAGGGGGGYAGMMQAAKTIEGIPGIIAKGKMEKFALQMQVRQMEKAMAETKLRATKNMNVLEESAKQNVARQQVARATQGKVSGVGSDYLLYNDTIDKMAADVTNMAHEVGYELHSQRFGLEQTKTAADNAMKLAVTKALNALEEGAFQFLGGSGKLSKEATAPEESSPSKYNKGGEKSEASGWAKQATSKLGQAG